MNKKPIMYIAIGPSGVGKSTIYNRLKAKNPDLIHYSWDALRHEFYDAEDYSRAFEMSCKDKEFKKKIEDRLLQEVETGNDIYIDNTNLTVKRRKPLLELAKKYGYKTIAITFDVSLKTVIERQQTRGDKCVPESVCKQMFNSVQGPMFSEGFDRIIDSNEIK